MENCNFIAKMTQRQKNQKLKNGTSSKGGKRDKFYKSGKRTFGKMLFIP